MKDRIQCEECAGILGVDFVQDEWCEDEGLCATCFAAREGVEVVS